jgi:hypothetical protein
VYNLFVTRSILLTLLLLLIAGAAAAAPVTWYLSGVRMADGAIASGSFVYDASTGVYSSVNITTSGGTVFTGAHFIGVVTPWVSSTFMLPVVDPSAEDFTDVRDLPMTFVAALTNGGGTVGIDTTQAAPKISAETTCENGACSGPPLRTRNNIVAGVVTTILPVPVPTLSEYGLGALALLLGCSAAVLLRRRRTLNV